MAEDLANSIPFVTTTSQSLEAFAVDLRISGQVLRQLNPHLEDMQNLDPGIPVNLSPSAYENLRTGNGLEATLNGGAPADYAILEWNRGIDRYAGPNQPNPEIEKYHATTDGVAPDDIGWCSSFVNWCVRQAGMQGTDNKAARSWHKWGTPTESPHRGDIVVFRRKDSSWKGHVGFYWEDAGDSIRVLGGNQSNSVRISRYPRDGSIYALLSCRSV
jgi:uncharacterized protein (TIGR02594 family)